MELAVAHAYAQSRGQEAHKATSEINLSDILEVARARVATCCNP